MPLSIAESAYPEVMTCVYRFFSAAGKLLYVGVAYDFDKRFKQHAAKKDWWPQVALKDVIWFSSRLDALYEEARAIENENPIYNDRPGLQPLGAMIVRRTSSRTPRWSQVGELVVSKYGLDQTFREVIHDKSHAVLTYDGATAGVAVPP